MTRKNVCLGSVLLTLSVLSCAAEVGGEDSARAAGAAGAAGMESSAGTAGNGGAAGAWKPCGNSFGGFGGCEFMACEQVCDHYLDHGCGWPGCFEECKSTFEESECKHELRLLNDCYGYYAGDLSKWCGDLPAPCTQLFEDYEQCAGPEARWWWVAP